MNLPADDQEAQALYGGVSAGIAGIGLEHGPQPADRSPLGPGLILSTFAKTAQELVALAPDVIIVAGGASRGGGATGEPDGADRVRDSPSTRSAPASSTSLARPGGNVTGFTQFEYSLSGKWLQLLKEIAPSVTRVAVLRDLGVGSAGIGQWAVIQAVATNRGGVDSDFKCATPTRWSAVSLHSRVARMAA